ncbi:hypothetical protein IAT38_001574 [Cryptococcus sp. DSM 104549]
MSVPRSLYGILNDVDPDTFDWSSYEGTYQGRALITRLTHLILFTYENRGSSPRAERLVRAAILRVIPHLKATLDYDLYSRMMALLYGIVHPGRTYASKYLPGDDMDVDEEEQEAAGGSGGAGASGKGDGAGEGEEEGVPDEKWLNEARETSRKEYQKLSVELSGYMSNLIKESIRLTHLAFVELNVKMGNISEANKHFNAAREHSSSLVHHLELGQGIVESSLAFNLPASLSGHISRLESTLDRTHPPAHTQTNRPAGGREAMTTTAADIRERQAQEARNSAARRSVMARVRVGRALLALSHKEWERAGRELLQVEEEEEGLGDWEGKAISTADMALMEAFCFLASADRDRIRRVLLDKASFKSQVDDSQSWVVDLVHAFVDAKYRDVMTLLRRAEPVLLLNPFLSIHTRSLVNIIETRAIVQYVQPFSSVQISTMAQAFGSDEGAILETVEKLVATKEVKGKIDLIDNVLVIDSPDYRGAMFEAALRVGKKSSDMSQAAFLRMSLTEAGIIVDPRPKSDKQASLPPLTDLEFGSNHSASGPSPVAESKDGAPGSQGGSGAFGGSSGPGGSFESLEGLGS